MKLFASLIVIAFGLVNSTTSARADAYIGVLLGPSFVNNNFGTEVVFGGDIGVKVRPDLGIGVYATHETLNSNTDASETTLAAEANYFLPNGQPFYVGAKAGAGFISNSFIGSSSSETDFIFGPAVGFSVPMLLPSITVGAEANVLFLESSSTDVFANIVATLTVHF